MRLNLKVVIQVCKLAKVCITLKRKVIILNIAKI